MCPGYITSAGTAAYANRLTSVSITNLNTDRTAGSLEYYDKSGGTGAPSDNWHSYISTRHGNTANQYGFQLANQFGTETLYFRGWDGSNPYSWRTIIHSGNVSAFALTSLPAHNHDASNITSGTLANARTTASSANGSDTIVLRDSSGHFNTESIAVNKYLVVGGYRTYGLGGLGADGTQAKRYEIARIGIDYNDWNTVGSFEVELHEQYYGQGLKKVYNIWYGYVSNSGLRLVEYRGDGANNFRVTIGSEVVVSGDHRYLPVYVDVKYYGGCHVVVRTNRPVTTNSNSGVGSVYIFTSPTGTNISDFTADSVPEFSTSGSATIGGNTILTSSNYNSYSPTLTGGNASGTWGINITGSAGSASSATSATQVVTIQDSAPSAANGKLWWESDTGKLKVYWSSASAWVDASPVPDMSIYYPKAGGVITGDVSIGQTLNVVGNTLVQGTISAFGDVIAYASSDRRLKDNITVIESPLEKISKISGVSFSWNDKQSTYEVGKKDYGVIAQEIEEVLPELVTTRDTGYKAVRYEKIVPVLIEGIKEQQAQINEQQAQINDLKELVTQLLDKVKDI